MMAAKRLREDRGEEKRIGVVLEESNRMSNELKEAETQTTPVLLFGNKLELYEFTRNMLQMTHTHSRGSQACPSTAAKAVQASTDKRNSVTMTETADIHSSLAATTPALAHTDNSATLAQMSDKLNAVHVMLSEFLCSANQSINGCDDNDNHHHAADNNDSLDTVHNRLPDKFEPHDSTGETAEQCEFSTPYERYGTFADAAAVAGQFQEGSASSGEVNNTSADDDAAFADDGFMWTQDAKMKVEAFAPPPVALPGAVEMPGGIPMRARMPHPSRFRYHRLTCVPNHRSVPLTSYSDVRETEADEEFRVDSSISKKLLAQSCSVGNFGWRLVMLLYHPNDLRDCNYFGNRGKRPLSPRRLHAIEHAYYDHVPAESVHAGLTEARCAINQGLRNITHNYPAAVRPPATTL